MLCIDLYVLQVFSSAILNIFGLQIQSRNPQPHYLFCSTHESLCSDVKSSVDIVLLKWELSLKDFPWHFYKVQIQKQDTQQIETEAASAIRPLTSAALRSGASSWPCEFERSCANWFDAWALCCFWQRWVQSPGVWRHTSQGALTLELLTCECLSEVLGEG